jgi:hypothetical protein
MAPNIDQPFMTPAAYKNKIYFMWDFIGRTLDMLLRLDAHKPKEDPSGWEDVTSRAMFGNILVHDTTGKLEMMCPDDRGANVQFGEEIENLAAKL